LFDNVASIFPACQSAYQAFINDEALMVVSSSTD
jgi:hypothetical protein